MKRFEMQEVKLDAKLIPIIDPRPTGIIRPIPIVIEPLSVEK